jgi:CTP:molybdopterin cytidylyltransferase MocA
MIGAVVLAAGRGSRMGCTKAFLPLPGQSLLAYQLAQLPTEAVKVVVVPAGASYLTTAGVAEGVAGEVGNPRVELGPYLSVKLGLEALPPTADPIFVVPVDCPLAPGLCAAMLAALEAHPAWDWLVPVEATRATTPRTGHPVLLRGALRQALLAHPDTHRLDLALAPFCGAQLPWASPLPFLNLNLPQDHQALVELLDPQAQNPKETP